MNLFKKISFCLIFVFCFSANLYAQKDSLWVSEARRDSSMYKFSIEYTVQLYEHFYDANLVPMNININYYPYRKEFSDLAIRGGFRASLGHKQLDYLLGIEYKLLNINSELPLRSGIGFCYGTMDGRYNNPVFYGFTTVNLYYPINLYIETGIGISVYFYEKIFPENVGINIRLKL